MPKRLYTYLGISAADMKTRSDIPAQGDISVGGGYIDCSRIKVSDVNSVLSSFSYSIGDLCDEANEWSNFTPRQRSISSQELVNTTTYRLGDFAGYNHDAATPEINPIEGSGKNYTYTGSSQLVRIMMQMGEVDWPAISADITHLYCILSTGGSEVFTLEYELLGQGLQYVGEDIDFSVGSDTAYSCAFWFGKPADKKIMKFPGDPSYTINALIPADIEVTSVNNIDDGTEYDRMNITFNYTNSGSAGGATIYWEIRDGGLVDSGSQVVSFASGSGSRALTGISYPAAGSGYYMRVKEADDATWEVSNSFNVTS